MNPKPFLDPDKISSLETFVAQFEVIPAHKHGKMNWNQEGSIKNALDKPASRNQMEFGHPANYFDPS